MSIPGRPILRTLYIALFVLAALLLGSHVWTTDGMFKVSPYVQNVTTHSAVIRWETFNAQSCTLKLKAESGKTSTITLQSKKIGIATVHSLVPDTKYSYSISLSSGQTIFNGTLTTFPSAGAGFNFAAYGDSRSRPGSHAQVLKGIGQQPGLKFILHTGDLVERGISTNSLEREFFEPGNLIFDHIPVYPCLGNHDGSSEQLRDHFSLPGTGGWYSFKCADILFVVLDSNQRFGQGSTQYQWLIKTLQQNKGSRIVIMLHHPPYSSGPHSGINADGQPREHGIRDGRDVIPGLAKLYPIKLVISGHDHAYERSQRDGVTYIVAGGGGAPLYNKVNAESNPYSQIFSSELHYCIFYVSVKSIAMKTFSPDGKVIDKCQFQW